uniref:Uncharacterized protein n=1 Tax=Pectobacterium carotovorum TaxID=554 RepID=A0A0K0MNR6_PECCA|nr:hypothetical protein [Pectobacterium carotovorum]AKG47551.1 hypothetical protein pA_00111 [Pectobacterium carotovorum]
MSDETVYEDTDSFDFGEELDRKCLVSIELIVTKFEKNLITRSEAFVGIKAVFDAVYGLISPDVSETLNTVLTEIQKSEKVDKFPMLFAHKGMLVYLKLDLFSCSMSYSLIKPDGSKADKNEIFDNEQDALKAALTKAVTFVKNGAKRL